MQNGFKHSIPISSSIKLFKFINMTNSINILKDGISELFKKPGLILQIGIRIPLLRDMFEPTQRMGSKRLVILVLAVV
jgi:hypothetical protein